MSISKNREKKRNNESDGEHCRAERVGTAAERMVGNQQVSGRRDLKQGQSSSNNIKTEIKERCQRRARSVRSAQQIPRKKQTRNERTWAAVRRIPPRGPSVRPASKRGCIQHGCGQFRCSRSGSTPQRCGSRSDMRPSVLVTG